MSDGKVPTAHHHILRDNQSNPRWECNMTPDVALAALHDRADPEKAAEMAAYHKVSRPYLGISVPQIDDLAREWRASSSVEERISLAAGLWDSNIHEARVAAAKLFTQSRIRPDDNGVWRLIASWVPDFDAWAIADHVCIAGGKRLVANPDRIDEVALWTSSPHIWTRRAALVITLPWTKQNFPKQRDLDIRDRVLSWCAGYADDRDWFIQKAIAWWLRELSRHDEQRSRAWLDAYGARLKSFARKEASRHLAPDPVQPPGP
jgi:3-methyladenine DNA glycosylase AlkD